VIPLFPELWPHLEAAFHEATEGSAFVVTQYRFDTQNLRTQLLRILRRAGVKPWQRLFHNLRASRQTELADQFPLHVVTDWIGNSPDIADRHYLKTTDDHFRKAVLGLGARDAAETVVQNPAQKAAETGGNEPQTQNASPSEDEALLELASSCMYCTNEHIPHGESNNRRIPRGKRRFFKTVVQNPAHGANLSLGTPIYNGSSGLGPVCRVRFARRFFRLPKFDHCDGRQDLNVSANLTQTTLAIVMETLPKAVRRNSDSGCGRGKNREKMQVMVLTTQARTLS
jgi:hypothetical protein